METQPPSYKKKSLYEFGETLFSGSYATVKAATVLATGQRVTVKIISKKTFEGDIFEKEVGVLKVLNHPNIVNFIDWFESNDEHFIIVESASGQSMIEVLKRRGYMPEVEVKSIIKTILSAIEYVHSQNVIHRDLKLGNLLYKDASAESKLMIVGFGASKALSSDDKVLTEKCGSPGYSAPEIGSEQGYGKPIDLWSIGLNGGVPTEERIASIQSEDGQEEDVGRTLAVDRWNDLSFEVRNFIKALLSKDPAKRFTATSALNAIEHLSVRSPVKE